MSETHYDYYIIGTEIQWYDVDAALENGRPVFAVFRNKGREGSDYILELARSTMKKIIKQGLEWDAIYIKAEHAFSYLLLPFPLDGRMSGHLFAFRRDCRSAEAKTRDIKEFLDRLEENRR